MKKINLLGIEVKRYNKREEQLISIIKRAVKNFYSSYKNKPYSVGDAYNNLHGKIATLYFLELISYEDYNLITDRFFMLYEFTKERAENK